MSGQAARARLARAYDNPLEAARAAKEPVVGFVGNTTPVELILAAGRFPALLAPGLPKATPNADVLIEKSEPWPMRSLAEDALSGGLEFLELMVINRSEEWLYYNLKEALRVGQGEVLPPMHVHDVIQSQRTSEVRYNRRQTAILAERLERLAGGPLDPAAVADATKLMNRRRGLLRRLQAARDVGAIGGVEALRLVGGALLLHPAEACDLLGDVLDDLPAQPAPGPRVTVVTSEPLHHTGLHEVLESAGAIVTGEDSWWGSRAGNADVPVGGDLLDALDASYARDTQGEEVQPREARESWIRPRLEAGLVDGLVVYLPPSDKRFGWGYPRLRDHAEALGVPVLLIRDDVLSESGRAAIQAVAAGFTASLPGALELAGA